MLDFCNGKLILGSKRIINLPMLKNKRWLFVATTTSFIAAAALPALIVACIWLIGTSSFNETLDQRLVASAEVFGIVFVVASVQAIVLGIPAFLLGLRLRAIHWWSCIIMGFVIALGPGAVISWSEKIHNIKFSDNIYWGLFGASGGLAFWLIWQFWTRFGLSRIVIRSPSGS